MATSAADRASSPDADLKFARSLMRDKSEHWSWPAVATRLGVSHMIIVAGSIIGANAQKERLFELAEPGSQLHACGGAT